MSQKKDETYLRCCSAIKPGDRILLRLEDMGDPHLFDVVGKEKETNWILLGSMIPDIIPDGRNYTDFSNALGPTRYDQIDLICPGFSTYPFYGWYSFQVGKQRNAGDSLILQILKA